MVDAEMQVKQLKRVIKKGRSRGQQHGEGNAAWCCRYLGHC
jgi:hypothetical protein